MERANKPSLNLGKSNDAPQPIVNISDDSNTVSAKLPSGESVQVLLFGATVTSWKDADGTENLWLSEKAILDGSKPVRGGVPIVFPIFGPPESSGPASKLPQHGFARNVRWEYLGKSHTESTTGGATDNGVKLDFGLGSSSLPENTKSLWPFDFALQYSVTLSSEGLRTVITVSNEGQKSFDFRLLYHTYLRIKDIGRTKVTGLAGVSYVDKVLDATTHTQSTPDISFTGEVDRVYSKVPQSTTSVVEGGQPRFDVVRDNLADVVVWNPWSTKAGSMGDFAPKDGYINMVCIEAGSVSEWQSLEAGESWEGGQIIKSLK